MNRPFAQFLSYLFHPLLVPVWTTALLLFFIPSMSARYTLEIKGTILLALFIITAAFPMCALIFLKHGGFFSSYTMPKKEDRRVAFAFIALFYLIAFYLFVIKQPINALLSSVMTGMAVLALVMWGFTFFAKPSVHIAGLCSIIGVMLGASFKVPQHPQFISMLSILVLITGFTISARLYLKAHTINEIIVGAVVGLFITFSAVVILA